MTGPVSVGVDIGGTKTMVVVLGEDGEELARLRRPTPADAGGLSVVEAALRSVRDAVVAHGGTSAIASIGVAATGGIMSGVVTASGDHMPEWLGIDLQQAFSALGAPVAVGNDVHILATGLSTVSQSASGLLVTVGTGVGGAFLGGVNTDEGPYGTRGAVGHLAVATYPARVCTCGGVDHLEAHVSGPAILAIYREEGGEARTLEGVASRAADGDQLARASLQRAGRILGATISGFVTANDLTDVYLGGGVAGGSETFTQAAIETLVAGRFPPTRELDIKVLDDPGMTAAFAARWARGVLLTLAESSEAVR